MADSLGARLRQQRERQQIALASIAEQTKISLSLLEGLERDDVLRWPTGIFRRAFIRAYAQAIGLEPDSVVREFLEAHPDPVEVVATAPAAPPTTADEPVTQGPPTRLRCLIDRAMGSLPRRRLQQGLLGEESTLESATEVDRPSVKTTPPPEPDLAAAARLSTMTAIESVLAPGRDSAKALSPPRLDLAPAARRSPETAIESARATVRDSAKAASPPPLDLAPAARRSPETAIESARATVRDSAKAASPPQLDLAPAARRSTETARESARATVCDSTKAASPPQLDPAPAVNRSPETAPESARATVRDSTKAASSPQLDPAPAVNRSPETAPENARATVRDSAKAASPSEPDLAAAAQLCTELGRVLEPREVTPLLEGAAKILNAVGLIVWIWDPHGTALRPALAHGYPDDVLAQLPGVARDADNATATAFRSAQTRIVNGSDLASGAVVVPLMTPGGCGGVLAVELRHGREQSESVRALAMIFAAQLATLVGFAPFAEAVNA
jgi:transcriptional regulator with XRE-family HTH domain